MQKVKEKRILLLVGAVMIATEVIKQLLLTFVVGQGSYQWWYFPWQLCSIPMYVCVIAGLSNNERIYRACLAFLSDFAPLSGVCAFLDTSGFMYPIWILTAHSYIWHFALIAIGVYAWILRARRVREANVCAKSVCAKNDGKEDTHVGGNSVQGVSCRYSFLGGVCIYIIGCIIAEIINVLAFDSGHKPINMFYISPRYLMAQVYIRDMVPVMGNTACILLYIVVTIIGAALIELIGDIILRLTVKNADSGDI